MKRKHMTVALAAIAAVVASVLIAPAAQAAPVSAAFTKVSDWGSGFEGKVTVTNGTSSPISTWSIALDFPSGYTISNSWDAQADQQRPHPDLHSAQLGRTARTRRQRDLRLQRQPGQLPGHRRLPLERRLLQWRWRWHSARCA